MAQRLLLGFFLIALSGLAGCDSTNKIPTFKVSGTVELDGQPLEDGSIVLEGETPGSVPDSISVKDGKFAGEAKAGKKKVKFFAYKIGSPTIMDKKPVEGSEKKSISIKDEKLTAEVTAGGLNPSSFKVETAK
jgi:hypothetical protein